MWSISRLRDEQAAKRVDPLSPTAAMEPCFHEIEGVTACCFTQTEKKRKKVHTWEGAVNEQW